MPSAPSGNMLTMWPEMSFEVGMIPYTLRVSALQGLADSPSLRRQKPS